MYSACVNRPRVGILYFDPLAVGGGSGRLRNLLAHVQDRARARASHRFKDLRKI